MESNETGEVTAADFRSAASTYTLVAIILLVFYTLLRRSKLLFDRLYYPLYPHEGISSYENARRTSVIEPPKNWITFLFSSKREEEVLEHAGLDAWVTLRTTRLPLTLFMFWSLYAILFLIPAFAAAGDSDTIIERISLSSVLVEDVALLRWVFVSMLVFIATLIFLIKREYETFVAVRSKYLANMSKETYSVVVERVPEKLMTKRAMRTYFEAIMGNGSVHSITFVPKAKAMKSLNKLVAKRDKLLLQLEVYLAKVKKTGKPREIFVWETKTTEILEILSEVKIDTESVEETNADSIVSDKLASIINDESYKMLDQIVNDELDGYMKGKKGKSLLKSLSCGQMSARFINSGAARMVDQETFFQDKIKTLNLLISLLQKRTELFLQSVDATVFDEEERKEPTYEDYARVLDTDFEEASDAPSKAEEKTSSLDKIKLALKIKKPEVSKERVEVLKHIKFAAFVTFDNRSAANVASAMAVDDVRDSIRTSFARKPADMKVDNMNASVLYKTTFGFIGFFATVLFVAFFASFVSALGFITNLESLQGRNDGLDDFLDDNDYLFIISDQISPFLLVIAFALVSPILFFVYGLQKPISGAELNKNFFFGYYVFGVIQLFIFYQASSSVVTSLNDALDDPIGIIDTLAEAIPNNAIFFMQFILIKALFGLPLELLRINDLVLGVFLRRLLTFKSFASETPRERLSTKMAILSSPQVVSNPLLAKLNATTMLLYTIGISYCLIAPLMALVCLGYCVLFSLIFRNQFIFVYAAELKKIDTLGSQFEQIINTFFIALFLLVGTMTGVFSLKEQFGLSSLGIPLLVLIFLVRLYFNKLYGKELAAMPLSLAKFYDVRDKHMPPVKTTEKEGKAEQSSPEEDKYFDYRHPSLKAPGVMTLEEPL